MNMYAWKFGNTLTKCSIITIIRVASLNKSLLSWTELRLIKMQCMIRVLITLCMNNILILFLGLFLYVITYKPWLKIDRIEIRLGMYLVWEPAVYLWELRLRCYLLLFLTNKVLSANYMIHILFILFLNNNRSFLIRLLIRVPQGPIINIVIFRSIFKVTLFFYWLGLAVFYLILIYFLLNIINLFLWIWTHT